MQHVGSPLLHGKGCSGQTECYNISRKRESYNPSLLKELGSAQQTDTDLAQTHLDLALCTPDFQGDTVWILTQTLHLKSLP